MTPLRALLVDDEPLASRRLAAALSAMNHVQVVGTTTSARRAIDLVAQLAPDIVFLDISMPGLNGFEVLDRIATPSPPAIVFVTAFDTYAVRAFGVEAVDYLMKPVAPERLGAAVLRARAWLRARSESAAGEAAEPAPLPTFAAEDSLWAHRHQEFVRVPVAEIAWLEAEGDYVRIHAANGGGLLRTTLTALEAQLDPRTFMRVHRSAICRREAIVGMRRKPTGALTVSLSNGDWAPVGRTYGSGLRALLNKMRQATS